MLSCCCDSSSQGSQANFQPTDDRTAYDYAHGSGTGVPSVAGTADTSTQFAQPPTADPLGASLPEPPTYEAGDEAGLPPPPMAAPEAAAGPAKPDMEEKEEEEAGAPEDGPASAPPPPPVSAPPQDGAAMPASDEPLKAGADKNQPTATGMDKEKMRLQDLVKEFAKRAMKGVSCSIVDPDTGDVRPATYLVDRQLQKLTLKIDERGDMPATEETRHIGTISEIFVRKAGVEKLKPEAAEALENESKDRLVVIAFSSGSLCLLESSAEEATSFAVCTRVLHVYCKQKGLS